MSTADSPEDPLLASVPTVEGYQVLGKVVLLQRVGVGGMGIVYRGWHLTFRVEVAVKVLKPSLAHDPEYVVRFRREAEMALKITHQNVVRVYDVGEQHGLHYIVMEFVRGETVRARIRRWGRMRQGEAVTMVTAVASGLAEAHSHGIVHRDIKPENILLSRQGRVKLADLGLVRQVYGSDGKSLAGGSSMILGTPQYMAPEQWDTPDVRPSADVWALGAVLYYLLTGEHGIPQMPMLKMGRWVQDNPFPSLRTLPDLKPALHDAFDRCIDRDPKARYQNAGELYRALLVIGLQDDSLLREEEHRLAAKDAPEDIRLPSEREIAAIEARLANPQRPSPAVTVLATSTSPVVPRARDRQSRSRTSPLAWVLPIGALLVAMLLVPALLQKKKKNTDSSDASAAEPAAEPSATKPAVATPTKPAAERAQRDAFVKFIRDSIQFTPPLASRKVRVNGTLTVAVRSHSAPIRDLQLVVVATEGDQAATEYPLGPEPLAITRERGIHRLKILGVYDGERHEQTLSAEIDYGEGPPPPSPAPAPQAAEPPPESPPPAARPEPVPEPVANPATNEPPPPPPLDPQTRAKRAADDAFVAAVRALDDAAAGVALQEMLKVDPTDRAPELLLQWSSGKKATAFVDLWTGASAEAKAALRVRLEQLGLSLVLSGLDDKQKDLDYAIRNLAGKDLPFFSLAAVQARGVAAEKKRKEHMQAVRECGDSLRYFLGQVEEYKRESERTDLSSGQQAVALRNMEKSQAKADEARKKQVAAEEAMSQTMLVHNRSKDLYDSIVRARQAFTIRYD